MATRLTETQVGAYLDRIGVARPERADAATLAAIHRAHALNFTWEAIDCFMGWPSSLDPQDAFTKMVEGRRGGWCYEMNGLLGAALSACGFAVTRLAGGVRRADLGDAAIGNHLTLRVDLDIPWLADAGLGDALVDPVPLMTGEIQQQGHAFAIEQADGDWLRFRNHPHGGAPTFDFQPDHADEAALAGAQRWLLDSAQSPFRTNLVIQRHFPDRVESITNTVRRTITPQGVTQQPIDGLDQFAELLERLFALDLPHMDAVWAQAQQAGKNDAPRPDAAQ